MLSEGCADTHNASRCGEPTQPCKTLLPSAPGGSEPTAGPQQQTAPSFSSVPFSAQAAQHARDQTSWGLGSYFLKVSGAFLHRRPPGPPLLYPHPCRNLPLPRAIQSHHHCDTFHHSHQVAPFSTLLHFTGGFARGHTGSRILKVGL